MTGIYSVENPVGSVYIGQSRNLAKRLAAHRSGNLRCQTPLTDSYAKYGPDLHVITIIQLMDDDVPQDDLNSAEEYYLNTVRYCGCRVLNVREAGSKGKHSEETKRKLSMHRHSEPSRLAMSLAKKGKPLKAWHRRKIGAKMVGRVFSPETIVKMAIAAKLRGNPQRLPDATRLKMSKSQKLRFSDPDARIRLAASLRGHKCSPETRKKISAANFGKRRTDAERAVMSMAKRGVRHSLETRMRMSASRKGRIVSEATREKIRLSWITRRIKPSTTT